MPQQFTNNARALLVSGISAGDTSITIEASKADLFPTADVGAGSIPSASNWFKGTLQNSAGEVEIVYVRSRTGGSGALTNVMRGQEGTTARAYLSGTVFGLRITAQDVLDSIGHVTDTSAAHAASAISFTPAGSVAATDVQGAIAELDSEKLAASAVSGFGLTLIDDADAEAARATLGVPNDHLNTIRIDVASATTVSLTANAPNTRHINITGTTTITGFTVAAGQCYFVRFNAALTLTNSGTLVTQTEANITTGAGDTCVLRATAANTVEVLFYTKPLAPVVAFDAESSALSIGLTAVESTTYATTNLNVSSSFNATTGRFTAPVAGIYQFSVSAAPATNTASQVLVVLRKNGGGADLCPVGAAGLTGWTIVSGNSCLIQLAANDYVSAWQSAGGGLGVRTRTFSGFLYQRT